jgi:probable HAF family extracellular repeat protein
MTRFRISLIVWLAVPVVGVGLLAVAAAVPAAAAAKTYTITNLGSLGFVGYDTTEPTAINASGQVAGFSDTSTTVTFPCPGHYKPPRTCSSHPQHAFLWSNGTMTDLGSLGGTTEGSSGEAINVSGEVAGLSQTKTAGVTHAALWTGTTTVDLGALAPLSSGSWSGAFGINDSGQVVGGWAPSQSTRGTDSHPWLYSNGTMTSLPEPGGLTAPSCEAVAINNNGQILGNCTTASGTGPAVLWQNGTVTTLATLGGLHVTYATAINNLGQIAGYGTTSTGATDGFLDSNGTVTDLGSFTPFALNDNGVMIDPSGPSIDIGGTVQNLNNLIPANSGYTLNDAFAINDNGQIAAEANGQAVLLTPN